MERIVGTRGSNIDRNSDCPELYLLPKFLHVNSGTVPPQIPRFPSHSFSRLYGQICCQTDWALVGNWRPRNMPWSKMLGRGIWRTTKFDQDNLVGDTSQHQSRILSVYSHARYQTETGLCAVNHEEGMSREAESERLGQGTCVVNRGRGLLSTKTLIVWKH